MEQITRFYGRRKGKKLKNSRMLLMEYLLPKVLVYKPKEKEIINLQNLFPEPKKNFWLEIGFGGGEHLAQQALLNPDVGFIGAEPFVNGVASLLALLNGNQDGEIQKTQNLLDPSRTDNVRIFPDDIRLLFPSFQDECFEKIFVLYPDPWPKTRHEERRFLIQTNLKEIYRLLRPKGELRIATDVHDYALWAVTQIEKTKSFVSKKKDIYKAPEDWVSTRYEKKGLKAGRVPIYFIYEKIG